MKGVKKVSKFSNDAEIKGINTTVGYHSKSVP
jgi:hypothetical protein